MSKNIKVGSASSPPSSSGPAEARGGTARGADAEQDPQMRQAFFAKISAPIVNKMFECGMIP
jgi:hypothetical protein